MRSYDLLEKLDYDCLDANLGKGAGIFYKIELGETEILF